MVVTLRPGADSGRHEFCPDRLDWYQIKAWSVSHSTLSWGTTFRALSPTDRINAKDVRTPWEDARHGRIELKMSGTVKGLIGDDNKENRNY